MFVRPIFHMLKDRLKGPPARIQILAGPRQVGKTTLITQLLTHAWPSGASCYVDADEPQRTAPAFAGTSATDADVAESSDRVVDTRWLVDQWQRALVAAAAWNRSERFAESQEPFIFVIDEIQKVPQWSTTIKGLWDACLRDAQLNGAPRMHLVLLGSSQLLMQRGLAESLLGRFEFIPIRHWSFEEMNEAFGIDLYQYVYFGGFPGSAAHLHDEPRWRDYVVYGLIKPNIDKDILALTRIHKPALLRQLLELGCSYSGQIVALTKVQGQLQDAGNTTTLAEYLNHFRDAGLLTGLYKYSGHEVRQRASKPKFQVLNNALMSATGTHSFDEAKLDRSHWGRLVESAAGAHLCNTALGDTRIHYWNEDNQEVDFIVQHRGRLAGIEVKSGRLKGAHTGLEEFSRRYPGCRTWVVGSDELPLGEFLRYPAAHWVE
jgi:predicted AAA+ superfamily ATPase